MSSNARSSFYDPKQPVLLPDDEIAGLSPAECDAACLQIDQILVSVLQNIDADFSKSHRIITDKILPDLERHGESSKAVWEGLKLWQGLFEASANVKLSGNNGQSETASSAVDTSHDSDDDHPSTDDGDLDGTLASRRAAHDLPDSPFETLKEDLRQNLGIQPQVSRSPPQSVPAPLPPDDSRQSGSTSSLRRPPHWHDLSMDSPDTTLQAPAAQDLSLLMSSQSGISLDSGLSLSLHAPEGQEPGEETVKGASPRTGRKSGSRVGSRLLHQALMRDMVGGAHRRQTTSTPAKPNSHRAPIGASFPAEVTDPEWNGLADLRKIPLDGFGRSGKSRRKSQLADASLERGHLSYSQSDDPEESLRAGISPPQTIHFSVPRSKLAQTPSKEAARLVTRDVLETARFRAGYANPTDLEDSPPLEPPSVLREWTARGYESLFKTRAQLDSQTGDEPSPAELGAEGTAGGARPGGAQSGPSRDVSRSLIDLRDGDTGSAQTHRGQRRAPEGREDPFSSGPSTRSRDNKQSAGQSRLCGRDVADHGGRVARSESPPDSPTFFGIRHEPARQPGAGRPSTSQQAPQEHGRGDKAGAEGFVPMRPDEMDTFFGGNLLESECFEPSPLQGKRVRYTDPKP